MTVRSNAALYALGAVEPSRTVILGNNPRYIDGAIRAAASCGVAHAPVADLAKSVSYVNTDGLRGAGGSTDGRFRRRLGHHQSARGDPEAARPRGGNGVAVRLRHGGAVADRAGDGTVELVLDDGEMLLADRVIAASGVWNDPLVGAASPASLHTKAKVLKVFWFKLKDGIELGDFPNFIFKIKGGEEFAAAHPRFATRASGLRFRQGGDGRRFLPPAGTLCPTACT